MAAEDEFSAMSKTITVASGMGATMERVGTSASLTAAPSAARGSASSSARPTNQRIGQPTFIDDPGLKADLFRAIEGGDEIAVRKLIKHRVVVNWHDVNGRSPLALAAELGLSNVVKMLLWAGANPELSDGSLVTPLHLAVKGNHEEAVIWLLHFGAQPMAKTRSGMTPMDLAIGQSKVYHILKEFIEDEIFPAIPEK